MCHLCVKEGEGQRPLPDINSTMFQDNMKKLTRDIKHGLQCREPIAGKYEHLIFKYVANYSFIGGLTISIFNVDIYMVEFQKTGLPHAHILKFD